MSKPRKQKPGAKAEDKQARLARLDELTRATLKRATELRAAIVRGDDKRGRMLPLPGSRWQKHSAFLHPYETAHLFTFLMWAWGGHANNEQFAVLETSIVVIDGEPAKPYRRLVLIKDLVAEYVSVPAKRAKRAAAGRARKRAP